MPFASSCTALLKSKLHVREHVPLSWAIRLVLLRCLLFSLETHYFLPKSFLVHHKCTVVGSLQVYRLTCIVATVSYDFVSSLSHLQCTCTVKVYAYSRRTRIYYRLKIQGVCIMYCQLPQVSLIPK